MKKIFNTLISCMVLFIFFFSWSPTYAYEINALTPRFEVLIPGVSLNFEITQQYNFPQDFSIFTVALIGYGPVSISLSKELSVEETPGNLLVITGVGISSAGIIPFFKFGRGDVDVDVTVEIGSERSPFGLLLFSSWMTQPADAPDNTYTITLSF